MKQYKVTLNFTFKPHTVEDGYEEGEELQQKEEAFERTDAYYQEHSVVEHIKKNDAFAFVEYVTCDAEVISAEWDPKKFAIHMIVDADLDEEELKADLRMNSLEDGEYEACGDTGWIVMTRGKNGEVYDGDFSRCKDFWEYGLTDYRRNPIEVKLLGEKPEIPPASELFNLSEKGKEMYENLTLLRKEGIQLSEQDERNFRMMCELMKDARLYPVGKA